MTCDEFRELLAAYIDGVLSDAEAERVAAHLDECARCPGLAEQAARFQAAFRRNVGTVRTPEGARARVLAAAGPRPTQRRPLLRKVLVGAVAAALLLGVFPLLRHHGSVLASIADDVLAAERGTITLDFRTEDPDSLAAFFARSAKLEVGREVTDMRDRGWRLVGGAIWRQVGANGTVALYQRDGKVVLCHRFALPPKGRLPVDERGFYSLHGVTIYVSRHGREVCCLTSRMPREQFIREVLGGNPNESLRRRPS